MIIDRFENDFAVIELENGNKVNMPKVLLPADAKEGDAICIAVDTEKTVKQQTYLQNKLNSLFKD